ncbi:MAG: TadE/TadG family type IV pilus assembly protein [Desulfovibrionaceae bacterium]
MRQRNESQGERGMAAVEFALVLPALMMLLFLIVEGAGALHTRMQLVESSREVARLVLRDGADANVSGLAASLAEPLSGTPPTVSVNIDGDAQTITVQVDYAYQSIFGDGSLLAMLGSEPYQLSARTIMPLP